MSKTPSEAFLAADREINDRAAATRRLPLPTPSVENEKEVKRYLPQGIARLSGDATQRETRWYAAS